MSVRLFAGLPLDAGTRATLTRLTADVRRSGWPVRWVAPEAWHLTVKFYGEREEAEVAPIGAGLADAVQGTPPLDLQFTALGANAAGRRARVLWLDVEAPAALELLHHRVELAGQALGIEAEGRPFRPHLTIGRVRNGAVLPPGAGEQLTVATVDVAFLADRLVLFESTLGPGGPRYTERATFPLEQAA
jgi:2'-5' RNA ligase